ncbi:hypothetical protein CAP36_14110 [Chitinophagaceae bacterium IBVUCB2]|nr:hypothetical protein CAP36_14110 [Chitinophagaceae bacterium IBVUCB2]
MKKLHFSIFALFFTTVLTAQQLEQISFANASTLTSFGFIADRNVLIRINSEGKIMEWGIEVKADRAEYYAPQLQPYMGRVEYYTEAIDSVIKGKIKSIGTCNFTYYGSSEISSKAGKIRTIGNQAVDYYTNYDNAALNGKMKSAGTTTFEYYSSFENESFKGKLKSVANNAILYHSSFDDKLIRGRIKSIGATNFQWYTSLDIGRSGLKSGSYRQRIGNITYILL